MVYSAAGIPIIDLSGDKKEVAKLIIKACEELGFFQVINHGVQADAVSNIEAKGKEFFSLTVDEKQKVGPPAELSFGPPTPFGYGKKNIGYKGDTGELEYLFLPANPQPVSQKLDVIDSSFSCAVNEYLKAMKGLASEILDLMGLGLGLRDTGALGRMIKGEDSDCWFRFNYYPSSRLNNDNNSSTAAAANVSSGVQQINGWKDDEVEKKNAAKKIGFGEHSDPQILSLLRSTDDGLHIQLPSSGDWVPVQMKPEAFCVNVGDVLQALTNGRLVSVRHKAEAGSSSSRLSLIFFGGPAPSEEITPFPEMITDLNPRKYNTFTWGEYKNRMYTFKLVENRLEHYRAGAVAGNGDLHHSSEKPPGTTAAAE